MLTASMQRKSTCETLPGPAKPCVSGVRVARLAWRINLKLIIRGIAFRPGSHARCTCLALGQRSRVQQKLLLAGQPQPLLLSEVLRLCCAVPPLTHKRRPLADTVHFWELMPLS